MPYRDCFASLAKTEGGQIASSRYNSALAMTLRIDRRSAEAANDQLADFQDGEDGYGGHYHYDPIDQGQGIGVEDFLKDGDIE